MDNETLLLICENFLEDNEITEEEIREIDNYLQKHPEESNLWPNDILIDFIATVLKDNKINKTEIKKAYVLLRKITKEWHKKQEVRLTQLAIETAEDVKKTHNQSIAKVPAIPAKINIKSHSHKNLIYEVDLNKTSCTCPDWLSHRKNLPEYDLTRCCKHIFDAYNKFRPSSGWPGWLEAFLETGWRAYPTCRWKVSVVRDSYVLIGIGNRHWVDIYAKNDNKYRRYGFNKVEKRWSYGDQPELSNKVLKEVYKFYNELNPSFLHRLFQKLT